MTYDEFADKLKEIQDEFRHSKKSELVTIKQLEEYLMERKTRRMSRGLKSLKGLNV